MSHYIGCPNCMEDTLDSDTLRCECGYGTYVQDGYAQLVRAGEIPCRGIHVQGADFSGCTGGTDCPVCLGALEQEREPCGTCGGSGQVEDENSCGPNPCHACATPREQGEE